MSLTAALVFVAAVYGLISGFNDGGNLIASFTAGRVITPRIAILLLLPALAGPLLLGSAVAKTVATSVIDLRAVGPSGFTLIVLVSVGVVLLSWLLRVPTSMTLALVGAMIGWALVGRAAIHWTGVGRVLLAMPLSVLGGLIAAGLLYRGVRVVVGHRPHQAVLEMARMQYLTAALQSVAYGANDMEKTIGLVAVARGIDSLNHPLTFSDATPLLVAFASFGVGTLLGGWRIAHHVGFGICKVRPTQAAAEQAASAVVVAVLAVVGLPVSSTQTIDGGLIGVGAANRAGSIHWGVVRQMLSSWLITLPLAMLVAGLARAALHLLGGAG